MGRPFCIFDTSVMLYGHENLVLPHRNYIIVGDSEESPGVTSIVLTLATMGRLL